jgi:2-polyprenyl-6-methoxyphenol hydroxylase-like FAD-dependent oxidoreductase
MMRGLLDMGWHLHQPQRNRFSQTTHVSSSQDTRKEYQSQQVARLHAQRHYDAVIVGGGPAGMASAVALERIGMKNVVVLEKREEEEVVQGGTALGLWTNAWKALDVLGVGDTVRGQSGMVSKVEICREEHDRVMTSFHLDSCDGGPHEFGGVLRGKLVSCLKDALVSSDSTIQYGVECSSCVVDGETIRLQTSSGSEYTADMILGADGVNSVVANMYGICNEPEKKDMSVSYVGQTAIRGIAEYCGDPLMPRVIRQVLGKGVRAGVYPVSSNELYWYVCYPDTVDHVERVDILGKAREVLLQNSPSWKTSCVFDALERTPPTRVSMSRLGDRWDIQDVFSSRVTHNIALAGDALHPMTPNLGQGGCTALEDAIILASYLKTHMEDDASGKSERIRHAINEYTRSRARRCVPLTIRANVMGRLLQSDILPIVLFRDAFISNAFDPSHFLDHATYDCSKNVRFIS